MSTRQLDHVHQDSLQPASRTNSVSKGNSSGKGPRRLSGTFHRRNSSAVSLPPVDLLATEAAVYQALTEDEQRQLNDDGEVTRYVKACNGNQAEALKRLRATMRWRAKELPTTLLCNVCKANPKAHFMHVVGHDDLGRPIIYSCLRNATNRNTEDNRLHMLATFEQAIRMMPDGVSQWVWASDFHGFGYKDIDPKMARIFLHVSAEHYPERLAHFFVIDPPSVFSALWRMVQPWVDPVTKSKVTFCSNKPAEIRAVTKQQHFSEELTTWLLAEMAENRNSKMVKAKVYDYAQLESMIREPHPSTDTNGVHSVYGTASLIKFLQERPEVLCPKAAVAKPDKLQSVDEQCT